MKKSFNRFFSLLFLALCAAAAVLLALKGKFLAESFYENIIASRAYVAIGKGLLMTVRLTIESALIAALTGAVFCALRMSGITALSAASSVVSGFLRGVPAVSLLMILYFCVFTSRDADALAVAALGYGLYSGAYVGEIFRTGLASVDPHETEAARMLGLTASQAFFRITLPQAWFSARRVYTDSVISLLQWTSVASYISITELTKTVSNLAVRTGNAFFALFLSALLYLALSWIIRGVLSLGKGGRARHA